MVMLAMRGGVDDIASLQEAEYLFDLKIDGVRCRADIRDGVVRLSSRHGTDMTHRYPEVVAALLEACPAGRLELDGEIAVTDDRGLPSWPLTHKRDAQQSGITRWARELPATYFVFDILSQGVRDMRGWAYANRRQVLTQEAARWHQERLQPVLNSADGVALWEVVRTHRLEGVIAKRASSGYRDGRSRDWIKIKHTSTATCLVGGIDPGEGSRASTFGALHLYVLNPERELVQVGKVGSGFSDHELRQVMRAMESPPVIVEVEFLDISPEGQLRQPVFNRLRPDAELLDCTSDQFGA